MRICPFIRMFMRLVRRRYFNAGGGARFDLPLADGGSGSVNLVPVVGDLKATVTRATAAAAKLSTGLWKLDVASGVARGHYLGWSTAVVAYGGFLSELAATNECLHSRDLTNAVWVAGGDQTTAKTSTGIDGVANSCTRLTSTIGAATFYQAVSGAAVERTFSAFVRRVTGTGTIQIAFQNGITSLDITSLINSTTYTRVTLTDTVLNPEVGFNISDASNAIDVDCCQLETGPSASTPIVTTTAAVTRNADVLVYTGAADFGTGSMYCEATSIVGTNNTGSGNNAIAISDGTNNERVNIDQPNTTTNARLNVSDGGVAQAAITILSKFALNTTVKLGGAWTTNLVDFAADGALGTQDTAATMPTTNRVYIGCGAAGTQQFAGCVKNVKIWNRALSRDEIDVLTT